MPGCWIFVHWILELVVHLSLRRFIRANVSSIDVRAAAVSRTQQICTSVIQCFHLTLLPDLLTFRKVRVREKVELGIAQLNILTPVCHANEATL